MRTAPKERAERESCSTFDLCELARELCGSSAGSTQSSRSLFLWHPIPPHLGSKDTGASWARECFDGQLEQCRFTGT